MKQLSTLLILTRSLSAWGKDQKPTAPAERKRPVPSVTSGWRRACSLLGVAGAFGLATLVVLATAAHAQTARTLVSNLEKENMTNSLNFGSTGRHAQRFTVGPDWNYRLTAVTVDITAGEGNLRLEIYTNNNGRPGESLYSLTAPDMTGTGHQTYTAPENATLKAGEEYFLQARSGSNTLQIGHTNSNEEDSGGESEWSIYDKRLYRTNQWYESPQSIKMKISGYRTTQVSRPTATLEAFVDTVEYADGRIHYLFDLKLSERVWIHYKDLRDHAFDVTNGTILKTNRIGRIKWGYIDGRWRKLSKHWRMTVEATDPDDPVSVSLEAKACSEQGAVCSVSGGKLANEPELDLEPPSVPLGVSIADTTASEDDGVIVFRVSLSKKPMERTAKAVEIDFKTTTEGTATQGEDFRSGKHLLVLFPGEETNYEIGVGLIADDVDDDGETVIVQLTEARLVKSDWTRRRIRISDDKATGTIENSTQGSGKKVASGLAPNFPNPFNANTLIPYRLAAPGAVRLEIYNLLGQSLRTLVDQYQDAGLYKVRWDARDRRGAMVSAGMYLVRLHYPGGMQTKRLLYLK